MRNNCTYLWGVTLQYVHIMYDDQIRITGISITLGIYPNFVLGIFKILSGSYFEIFDELFQP
jgi:hypothetical protein